MRIKYTSAKCVMIKGDKSEYICKSTSVAEVLDITRTDDDGTVCMFFPGTSDGCFYLPLKSVRPVTNEEFDTISYHLLVNGCIDLTDTGLIPLRFISVEPDEDEEDD